MSGICPLGVGSANHFRRFRVEGGFAGDSHGFDDMSRPGSSLGQPRAATLLPVTLIARMRRQPRRLTGT